MGDDKTRKMLSVNADQASYYDATDGGTVSIINSRMTNLWRRFRHRAISSVPETVRAGVYDVHKAWLGDLSGAKVLELGCGSGSALTEYLADNARAYHAIDLSAAQIGMIGARLGPRDNVTLHTGDVLAEEFTERGFDVIYAQSVFHHFRFIDVLFDRIDTLLAPDGRITTLDPVQAWWPARLIRAAFRPFQTDAEWEYPFTAATLKKIENRFAVRASLALFNRAKWALAVGLFLPERGARMGERQFRADLANQPAWRDRRAALQISYLLGRK